MPGEIRKSILLVEDMSEIRVFIRTVLETQGFSVIEAANGLEALRAAGEHNGGIQLLLTDVIMPQMGGRELAERLRMNHPELRVLFISGFDFDLIGELQPGMMFLQKPFSADLLTGKVREILSG